MDSTDSWKSFFKPDYFLNQATWVTQTINAPAAAFDDRAWFLVLFLLLPMSCCHHPQVPAVFTLPVNRTIKNEEGALRRHV